MISASTCVHHFKVSGDGEFTPSEQVTWIHNFVRDIQRDAVMQCHSIAYKHDSLTAADEILNLAKKTTK